MTCEGADYSLEPLPSIEGYTYHAHSPLSDSRRERPATQV